MNPHRDSALELLAGIPGDLDLLRDEYKHSASRLTLSPQVRIHLLDFLVHNRAVLDYLAHDFVAYCSRKPERIYFPIASTTKTRDQFLGALDRDYLPGLSRGHPALANYLDSVQHYHGNDWLPAFATLANTSKHVRLAPHVLSDCRAVVLCCLGRPLLQIGDRGLGRLEIQAGGTFRARGRDGRTYALRGPQVITTETTSLSGAHREFTLQQAAWRDFKFEVFPGQPALIFVEMVERNVKEIAKQLMTLLP
ncbi:MAG: hypothetical protein AB2L07_02875 [Thermoanaerobaculaceae bacterium]